MFSYVYKDLDIAHKFDVAPVLSSDYAKHYHDYYEIYFFVKGNVFYTVEGERRQLKPGDILLISPGEHHFVSLIDKTPYERYVLKFQDNLVPDFLKDSFMKRSAFYSTGEKYFPLFEKLDALYETYYPMELQLLFSGIITELLINLNHSAFHEKTQNADNHITSIIQYINENIRRPITMDDLCKEFHFSQSHLYKEFHKHMKIPVMTYIRSKKIIAAHQLIYRGAKPTKIAESFGFMEYSTFYRAYISVIGFPPGQFKQK